MHRLTGQLFLTIALVLSSCAGAPDPAAVMRSAGFEPGPAQSGDQILTTGGPSMTQLVMTFASGLDAPPADITIVSATRTDGSTVTGLSAIRVAGTSPEEWRAFLLEDARAFPDRLGDVDAVNLGLDGFAIVRGDTLWMVTAPSRGVAASIAAKL